MERQPNQIYSLIPKAMRSIGAVGKEGWNPQQRYAFRGIDQLYNAVQRAFVEHGIFCVPRVVNQHREERKTQKGGVLIYTILTVEHDFYAPDGSKVTACTVGEAMDSGDKSSNKAMSSAMKYALIEVFAIPTEGDNDTEHSDPDPAPKEEADLGEVFTADAIRAMKGRGFTEMGVMACSREICRRFKVNYLREVDANKRGMVLETILGGKFDSLKHGHPEAA